MVLSDLTPAERQALDSLIGKLERCVATWMTDVELLKANRRHGRERTG